MNGTESRSTAGPRTPASRTAPGAAEAGPIDCSNAAPAGAPSGWGAAAATSRVGAPAVGARRAARGLAALAALAAVLIGVPVALRAFGQGPPSAIPSWAILRHALAHSLTDTDLLRGAGVVCWLAWALFALAVAIEIVGQLFDLGRRLPASRWRIGIPGLQGWARTLVLSAALLLPQRAVAGVDTSAAIPAVAATAVAVPARPPIRPLAQLVVAVNEPSSPTGGARYVVQRYDSLWAIAERHLGSGIRWREIRDEGGRPLGGDGPLGTTIYPGEVLLLPQDGPAASCGPLPATAAPLPAAPAPSTVSSAPSGARPATATATAPAAGAASAAAPTSTAPTSTAPASTAPTSTGPTSTGPASRPSAVPPAADPAPAVLRPAVAVTTTTATAPDTSTPSGIPAADGKTGNGPNNGAQSSRSVPTASIAPPDPPPTMVAVVADRNSNNGRVHAGTLVEGSLVGVAVLSTIQVLRRRQARHRPPGHRISPSRFHRHCHRTRPWKKRSP